MKKALHITPNRRLARFLQEREDGRFLAWNDWLDEIWKTEYELIVGDQPLQSLSDWQSALLWQRIIDELHVDPLLNKVQAVAQARAAWSLSIQWQVDPLQWKGEKTETDAFIHWLEAYQNHCEKHHWVDRAILPVVLYRYWKNNPRKIPQQVNFRGFDELTPLQLSIIDYWKSEGASVEIEAASVQIQPYQYLSFEDRDAQLRAAAEFAQEALDNKPELPIGIVIPAIQDDWANIYDTFTEILGRDQPFNISAGQPLGQTPVIYAAIECLRIQSVSYLLRTPYLAGGLSEQSERAICDQRLSTLESESLPNHFIRGYPDLPAEFRFIFDKALAQIQQYQSVQCLPSEWIEKIFALLTLWGWPGDRKLNSVAYQAVTHFYRLITDLASLDLVLGQTGFSDLINILIQRLNQTMFQAESQDKPIQVLGFLEAAGMQFSHLWVMDMGSDTWPAKPSPNPFIPMSVQIQLNIPHASFARELQFAQTMTQRMLTASQNIVMSFASHQEEGGLGNLPTPLLSESPVIANPVGVKQSSDPHPGLLRESPRNDDGLPLKTTHLKGGSRIFKDQADCPFRAYARHRLSAIKPEKSTMGLSDKTRGTLVHEVLEKVWTTLKTREALFNLGSDELDNLLREKIKHAIQKIEPPLTKAEADLETRRLIPILKDWFRQELDRPPFKILALEKDQQVNIEGLSLKLRIDRIDQIGDKICIIDYKTGEVNPRDWEPPRMDEPQLPLYACILQPEPQALAFAQIRKNDLDWVYSEDLDMQGWREAFKELADEFKSGYAAVLPKKGSATCAHCDLQSFCRVNQDE